MGRALTWPIFEKATKTNCVRISWPKDLLLFIVQQHKKHGNIENNVITNFNQEGSCLLIYTLVK